jgi:peptide-methionine (S)-S-oxide reductase
MRIGFQGDLRMTDKRLETATFAAGCFWGVEENLRKVKGVVSTEVGYTGGDTSNPSYEEVCTDKTGHAEAVRVEFDPGIISYNELLRIFFEIHDPTSLNRQGPDVGRQYRSAIFFHNEGQKENALAVKNELDESGRFNHPIVTEIVKAGEFFRAEEYHQKYYMKKGLQSCDSCGVALER